MLQYLDSAKRQFRTYKSLGEKAMAQMDDEQLNWQPSEDVNSAAMVVKHLWGNMMSRWTDFLTTDGEKPWRQRDAEFENDMPDRAQVMRWWEEGWKCLLDTLESLTDADLERIVYIRNDGDTVMSAINRQLTHYAYHVGQIVYIAKLRSKESWQSLSVPRGASGAFNAGKFSKEKEIRPFSEGPKQ